jgi:tripartite-type tricarboxylate transporter receptor subunit TctC
MPGKSLALRIALPLVCCSFLFFSFSNARGAGEDYPVRPIKLIIGFSPGGLSDLTWRSLADPIHKVLGQPLVIENKPGGAGSIGYTMVAASKPDGYTVGYVPLGSFINNYLMYDVNYDPLKNFTFICGVSRFGESIVVRENAPWKTWNDLLEYSKKHPGEVRVGFSGAASTNTVAARWIIKNFGLKWNGVTFPGDAEGITALLGGHIDVFPGSGAQNMLIKDGRAKMLLALTMEPIPGFPDVPNFKKLYGKNVLNGSGLMGPAGLPEKIVEKLERAVYESTKTLGFIKTQEKMNALPFWRTSKEFTQDIQGALKTSQELLKDLDMLKKK